MHFFLIIIITFLSNQHLTKSKVIFLFFSDLFVLLQVVVKDIVSRAVISQFRAHTSPISALCFDPSGTLLVTASIHGNNINIFRIMLSSSKGRSGSAAQNYDWTSSHVHLYKLHRGMTSAVHSCSLFLSTMLFLKG